MYPWISCSGETNYSVDEQSNAHRGVVGRHEPINHVLGTSPFLDTVYDFKDV